MFLHVLICSVLFIVTTFGAPQIALPFNAQVPSVARVSQPYSYQFSPSTFTSTNGDQLIYSIQNTPIWLQINSTTRTLYGTPESSNLGPLVFNLLADDGSGRTSMQATLVVVNSSAPRIGNITRAIATHGPLSDITTLSLRTGSPFSISMQGIFSNVRRPLYYATSSDHSPLPSWVQFDATTLRFSGSTPVALSAPQTYGISLHVSEVEGFSEEAATFRLAVGSHQLYFVPVQSQLSLAGNTSFEVSVLKDALYLDNRTIQSQDVASIRYQGPDWISFNNSTLTLSGKPPAETPVQNITFIARDIYGDTAVSRLSLIIQPISSSTPSFIHDLAAVNATIGEYFSYTIPQSSFAVMNFSASLEIPDDYPWLTFVASNLTIHGNVPNSLSPADMTTNLTITSNSTMSSVSRTLDIYFQCSSGVTGTNGTCQDAQGVAATDNHLSAGAAAGIGVAATIAFILFLLALAFVLYRTLKRDHAKTRPWISRPIVPPRRSMSDRPCNAAWVETDDEGSVPVVSTDLNARHMRMQSDGTYLDPADVDAITAMNRTSLGIGALRDEPMKEHSSTQATQNTENKIMDALRAKLGIRRKPDRADRTILEDSRPVRTGEAVPSLRVWAANRTQHASAGDLHSTLATPSMSSIGDTTQLETATPQTMTAFHYPKPSTSSQRPPPPIPVRSTERGNNIRLVSVTSPTPPRLPPIPAIASMTTEDPRPVHEKRQSYIRNRASDKNKGSRNALFAAGGGLDEDIDRGRSGRLLTVPKQRAKMLARSRSSSVGLDRASKLPTSIAEESASELSSTENWRNVHDDDDDDDYGNGNAVNVYEDVSKEERRRQDKRMKWRDRLNRNSKGHTRGAESVSKRGPNLGSHIERGDGGEAQEEVKGSGNRHARTRSWIRHAMSPKRVERLSQLSAAGRGRLDDEESRKEDGMEQLLDRRNISATTQASSTMAFL